jgi:hypothetical protein
VTCKLSKSDSCKLHSTVLVLGREHDKVETLPLTATITPTVANPIPRITAKGLVFDRAGYTGSGIRRTVFI